MDWPWKNAAHAPRGVNAIQSVDTMRKLLWRDWAAILAVLLSLAIVIGVVLLYR